MIDWDFAALLIADRFGWRLGEVFGLTLPQFIYIIANIERLAFWRARDEVFYGTSAAMTGGDATKSLMSDAGSLVCEKQLKYTKEDLMIAEKRMAEALKRQEEIKCQ